MAIKPGREYRDFSVERFEAIEDEESYIVEGYATVFDTPYELGMDGMKECISSEAFRDADMSDIIFLLNHEGTPLARQRNNSLSVMLDDHGLYCRAKLDGCQSARDTFESIKNRLIDRMSWAFIVAEDGWKYDKETRTVTITNIKKVFDVSAVSRPACELTEIAARSYINGVIEIEEQQELLLRQKEEREMLALSLSLLKG